MSDLQALSNLQLHDLELTIKHINSFDHQISTLEDTISKIKKVTKNVCNLTPSNYEKLEIQVPVIEVCKAKSVDYTVPKVPQVNEFRASPVGFLLVLFIVFFIPLK